MSPLPASRQASCWRQHQFLPLDGVAQIAFQVQLLQLLLLHLRREHARTVAPAALGLVHGRIGVAHQGIHVVAVIRVKMATPTLHETYSSLPSTWCG